MNKCLVNQDSIMNTLVKIVNSEESEGHGVIDKCKHWRENLKCLMGTGEEKNKNSIRTARDFG